MSHISKGLVFTILLLCVSAASSAASLGEPKLTDPIDLPEVETKITEEIPSPVVEEAPVEEAPAVIPWSDVPNICETFTVIEGDRLVKNKQGERVYPKHYKRNRYKRTKKDQLRSRDLIRFVAKEMGASIEGQYLVDMVAHHESSWNPEAIHILPGDLTANQNAYQTHSYNAAKERQLEETLARTDARSKEFWGIKAKLADIRLYKNNPYWQELLTYTYRIPEREHGGKTTPTQEWLDRRSVWSFGYGLFGMNAVLFTSVVSPEAPPWVLCADNGIPAIVTAIWTLRSQQEDCTYLSQKDAATYGTEGGTIRGILHRWGNGQCGMGRPGPVWRKLMESYQKTLKKKEDLQFAWETRPDFGEEFTQYVMFKRGGKWRYRKDEEGRKIPTDRKMVFLHMMTKAQEKGLLRSNPLELKSSASTAIARR